MAGNEELTGSFKSSTAPSRPTITLPPRCSFTEVSNIFADSDHCKSFFQLLAGAMASQAADGVQWRPSFSEQGERSYGDGGDGDVNLRFKQNRPAGLVIAPPPPFFAVPRGLRPTTLLDSPNLGLFSTAQGPCGMTHQQALAHVTAQAAQAQSPIQFPTEYPSSLPSAPTISMTQVSSFTANTTTHQQMPLPMPD